MKSKQSSFVKTISNQITTTKSIASEGLDLLNHSICSADEKTSTEMKQYTEILDISKDSAAQKCEWRPSKAHTKRKKTCKIYVTIQTRIQQLNNDPITFFFKTQ